MLVVTSGDTRRRQVGKSQNKVQGTLINNKLIIIFQNSTTLPSRQRHPRIFFAAFRVTYLMPRVCFKSITWYIQMHHVRTFFPCGVMTFSYYVIFIHSVFIFKRKAYRAFCLPLNSQHGHCLSAEDKIRSEQIRRSSMAGKKHG